MTLDEIKELALEAQRRHIKRWMLAHFVGGERRIEKWDDFRFHLSWFFTPNIPLMSDATARRWMRRLAESGAVEMQQHRKGGSLCWRFPREVCDQLGAEAITYWQQAGYSQEESRPVQTARGGD